jgi:outer membrane lipoprotein-sorting protein
MRNATRYLSMHVLFFSGVLLYSAAARAAPLEPAEIMQRMCNVYSNAISYSGTGVVEIVMSMGGQKRVINKPFAITFKRPRGILIEWTDYFGGVPTPYVLWNGTNGPMTYARRMNQLASGCDSLAQAIGSKSGTSGGSVAHVPDMLLRVLNKPTLSDIDELTYVATEQIEEVDCHRVSGTRKGKRVDLWIGKQDSLLRQLRTATPFGTLTEVHKGITLNAKIEDALVSFVPPEDVERVDKFDVRKNSK